MKTYKVIQVIKDPHIVFMRQERPRPTLFCEYRVLLESNEGYLVLVSADRTDLEGNLRAYDLAEGNRYKYEEVENCTLEVVLESIEGWLLPDFNSNGETEIEIAFSVLNDFRFAGKMTDDIHKRVIEIIRKKETSLTGMPKQTDARGSAEE